MADNKRRKGLFQKVWDVLYPGAAIILCMLIASVAGVMAAGLITGNPGAESGELLRQVKSLPLWISLGFYSLTLLTQRKQYVMDTLRLPVEDRGWPTGKLLAAALLAVSLGHLISTGIAVSGLPEIFPGYTEQAASAFEGQNPLLLTAATVILGPLAEELIFRGMICRRAGSYLGPAGGALVSAALFGLYHGNMVQFLYGFFLGLLLAVLFQKSGRLRTSVLAHGAANLWAIFGVPWLERLEQESAGLFPAAAAAEAAAALVCGWILFGKKKQDAGGKGYESS